MNRQAVFENLFQFLFLSGVCADWTCLKIWETKRWNAKKDAEAEEGCWETSPEHGLHFLCLPANSSSFGRNILLPETTERSKWKIAFLYWSNYIIFWLLIVFNAEDGERGLIACISFYSTRIRQLKTEDCLIRIKNYDDSMTIFGNLYCTSPEFSSCESVRERGKEFEPGKLEAVAREFFGESGEKGMQIKLYTRKRKRKDHWFSRCDETQRKTFSHQSTWIWIKKQQLDLPHWSQWKSMVKEFWIRGLGSL